MPKKLHVLVLLSAASWWFSSTIQFYPLLAYSTKLLFDLILFVVHIASLYLCCYLDCFARYTLIFIYTKRTYAHFYFEVDSVLVKQSPLHIVLFVIPQTYIILSPLNIFLLLLILRLELNFSVPFWRSSPLLS